MLYLCNHACSRSLIPWLCALLILHVLLLAFRMQSLPTPHQTLLFSATMPKEIEALSSQYLNNPVKVKIGRVSVPTANVAQGLERTTDGQKLELLAALLQVRCGNVYYGEGCDSCRIVAAPGCQ